jgi:hypothetical protein
MGTRYRVVGPRAQIYDLEMDDVVARVRAGSIKASTLIAPPGSEDFHPASAYDELSHLFPQLAGDGETIGEDLQLASRARVITYLTLAGLTAAMLMGALAPLCMLIGSFARFLLTTAAFGAVLGLGIHSALRQEERHLVNLSAAGFAGAGAVAWLFRGGAEFHAVHLAIIGFGGGVALAYGLGLNRPRAAALVVAATLLFPFSVFLTSLFAGRSLPFSLPMFLLPILALIGIALPALPFALFGLVLGVILTIRPDPMPRRPASVGRP